MFLFVYGTLRKGFPGEMAQKLATESEWIGQAVLNNAQLYRVHWDNFVFDYPALVQLDNNSSEECGGRNLQVVGDLVRLKNAEQSIRWLDEYEECGEQFQQPNEYIRKEVTVKVLMFKNDDTIKQQQLQQQQLVVATTYVFAWPIKDSAGTFMAPVRELVEDGDWLTFMKIINICDDNNDDDDDYQSALVRPSPRPAHPRHH